MGVYAGGAAASAAAAAAVQRMREEEEALTKYTKEDLNEGWEFKIVRSNLAIKGEKFTRLCEEEAQNGWELVEKFDDTRVRFKRDITHRADDYRASIDPYRTKFGLNDGALVGIVLGVCAVVIAVVLVTIFSMS